MTRSGTTRSQRRHRFFPTGLRLVGFILAAAAGGGISAAVGLPALLGPLDLRLGLAISVLLRAHPEAVPPLPDTTVLGCGAGALLILLVVVRTGVLGRLRRLGRVIAGAPASDDRGLDRPPGYRFTTQAGAAAGLDHLGSAEVDRATCWDGSQPQLAGRARTDPTGAIVTVTTITGSVGRASLAGQPCTVCSVGPRLRPGVPYVVLGRDGDVLVVATTRGRPGVARE